MSARLSRRRFLAGAGAATLLAACGSDPATDGVSAPQLVGLFSTDHVLVAGDVQRVPFAVVDLGELSLADSAEVPVTLRSGSDVIAELTVAGRVVDHDHVGEADDDHVHADLLRYYPLRVAFPEPGVYDLDVDFGQGRVGTLAVQAFAPDDVDVLRAGQIMPPLASPTTAHPAGADPLCTRAPMPCPFHDVSVAEALATGRPLAVLVATPALCLTAYCGPSLETLIDAAADHPSINVVHLEVYANAADVDGNYEDPDLVLAESVTELGLEFEPSLFLVGGDGTVVDRIDNLFDRTELDAALAALTAQG